MALDDRARNADGHFVGRAFGLDLEATFPLPGVPPADDPSSAHRATVELVSADELDRSWPFEDAVSLMHRIYEETQRPALTIDHHEDVGYRVFAPRYGRHIISLDGMGIRSALPPVQPWRWQRLLFAQVLPLAAALQGFELFHASAVALGNLALGFVAASGTGKTSVAVNLVGRGASLLTDDVLALEQSEGAVLAHPGGGMISVSAAELEALDPSAIARIGTVIGRSDKLHVATELVDGPLPLAALYFLSRNGRETGDVVFEAPARPDPRQLLSSSFISYVQTDAQLLNHLEVCARIAGSVPIFEVRVPRSRTAEDVAKAVEKHAEEHAAVCT